MKKYKIIKEEISHIVNEPEGEYENKRITFYNSIEEENEARYSYLASLTPIQHLENATALIKRVYAKELKKHPTLGNRIYFD